MRPVTAAEIDRLVDAFEASLSCNDPRSIENCLDSVDDHACRKQLLLELIAVEYEHQAKAGQNPTVTEYQRRFPGQAAEIAAMLVDRSDPHRDRRADGKPGSSVALPRMLGRFELREEIGRGTFGTVYRSVDTHLDRTVAVKVAHQTCLTDPESEHRFFREARTAAQLHHPGIVPVFDAVREGNHFLIVAELVDGQTLAQAMSPDAFDVAEAATLVAEIADALQYAHDQGVIHRDLKPSNIMLTPQGRPRVMDFGLAKRNDSEETLTLDGQLIGTPAYMAPEQAAGELRQVGHRSDVYGLGVILFQLLTGEVPFRGSERMVLRQVIEDDPRQPRSLNDRVPIDLQTICAKAMAKEPEHRYPQAAEFAADLRRWIRGEPIHARPIGRLGKAWRWAKRHPVNAALGACVVGLLVGISAISTVAAVRISRVAQREKQAAADALAASEDALLAREQERQARLEAQRDRNLALEAQNKALQQQQNATRVSEFIIGILKAADPLGISGGPGRAQLTPSDELVSIELLESIGRRIDSELAEQPKVRARLLIELADVHRSRGNLLAAEELIETANQLWLSGGSDDRGPARLHFVQARVAHDLGHYDRADQLYRSAIDRHERLLGRNHSDTATALLHHGWLLADTRAAEGHRGRDGDIEAIFREVLQIRRDQLGDDHRDTAVAMTGLLAILAGDGREREAKELLAQALQIYQAQPGGEQIGMAVSLFITGGFARNQGQLDKAITDYEKAIEIGRRILGTRHPIIALCLGELGGTYKQAGRFEEAEAAVLETLDIARAITKHGHPRMIPALVELADWRYEHQDFDACERLDLEVLRIWEHFSHCGHETKVCDALLRRGYLCYAQAMFPAAMEYYKQAIELSRSNERLWYHGAAADFGLARTYRAVGDLDSSITTYEGYAGWLKPVSPADPEPDEGGRYLGAVARSGYAGALIDRAGGLFPRQTANTDTTQLIPRLLVEGLTYRQAASRPDPIAIGENFYEAARWQLIQGNADQATEYARQSIQSLKQRIPEHNWIVAAAEATHAACLIKQQKQDEAKALLEPAVETLTKTLGAEHYRTIESQTLLTELKQATVE